MLQVVQITIQQAIDLLTSACQELLAHYRPSLTVPFNVVQRSGRHINRQSRSTTQIQQTIKLDYLMLMYKVDSITIPKVNSDSWNELIDAGFIELNITLSENNLNQQIYDLFPMLTGQEWKVFSPKSGKLKNIQNMEKTIDFLKNNVTKSPKKLYIGPMERDLIVLSPNNRNIEEINEQPTEQPTEQTFVASLAPTDNYNDIESATLTSPAHADNYNDAESVTLTSPASADNIESFDLTDTSYSTIYDDNQASL
ncbi:hypothetical protein C1646_758930 [Rhizophagus diaphanus]|nr:hypothetical protein C1646_758930 [Rhizophagus diaphanus] [Rhizophagus sp. MUCL 43196]